MSVIQYCRNVSAHTVVCTVAALTDDILYFMRDIYCTLYVTSRAQSLYARGECLYCGVQYSNMPQYSTIRNTGLST